MQLSQLPTLLADVTYPVTSAELSAALEDQTLRYPAGEESLSVVIERAGTDSLESAEDAWLSVMASVDGAAVGRKFYTDRDPPCGPDEFDAVSF